MFFLGKKPLYPRAAFTCIVDGKEESFPGMWLENSTQQERDKLGITWINDDQVTYGVDPLIKIVNIEPEDLSWLVDPVNFRTVLNKNNLRDKFEEVIKNGDIYLKDWWEFSTSINRMSKEILYIQQELKLPNANISDLFKLAKKLIR